MCKFYPTRFEREINTLLCLNDKAVHSAITEEIGEEGLSMSHSFTFISIDNIYLSIKGVFCMCHWVSEGGYAKPDDFFHESAVAFSIGLALPRRKSPLIT